MRQAAPFPETSWPVFPQSTSRSNGSICIVTLNRPKALNALCSPLFTELNDALGKYDQDKDIGAIIITGSEKAFAGTFPNPFVFVLFFFHYCFPLHPVRTFASKFDRPDIGKKRKTRNEQWKAVKKKKKERNMLTLDPFFSKLNSRRRHQRNGPPNLRRRLQRQLHRSLVSPRQHHPQARYRCRLRLRPRRRLRARHDV